MTTTIPPAIKDAAPRWEAATLSDLLDLSAASGVQAGLLYRAIYQNARVHAEDGGDA